MILRNKMTQMRHHPYASRMHRNASAGQVSALEHTGEKDKPAPRMKIPRTPSAPARLDTLAARNPQLDKMATTAQADLADAAYFSPAPPNAPFQPAASNPVGLTPNALALHAPAVPGLPATAADIDRGQVNLTEQGCTPLGRLTLNEARNVGGSVVGGTLETPQGAWPAQAKVGASAAVNGQTLAFAPAMALHDVQQNEMGAGGALFGSAHDEVRFLPDNGLHNGVAVEARFASTKGCALDPRLACGPLGVGAYGKVLLSQTNESLYRHVISATRAADLMNLQENDGFGADLKNRFRQWSRGVRQQPGVRQPDLLDPFGKNGGRSLRPGQELVRFCSQTRMFGGGLGFFGVRGGRHNMTTEDMHLTVRGIGDMRLHVTINPRDARSSSDSIDTLLGPGWQRVDSAAKAVAWSQSFDLRDPGQEACYLALVHRALGAGAVELSAPDDQVVERSQLQGHDELRGFVRLPIKTSWGGWGTHASARELQTERDLQGPVSKTREVTTQTTQHAGEQGKNLRGMSTSAHASLLQPGEPRTLAFRGLAVAAERSASRPDLAQRNAMVDEHRRLWKQSLPPVREAPRTDWAATVSALFSGRQLHGLQTDLPQRAAVLAKSVGATPEGLVELLDRLRHLGRSRTNKSDPAELAWQRAVLVSDYVHREGEPGFAVMHLLMGGPMMVDTRSSVYEAPLKQLDVLAKTQRITSKRAQKLKSQIETALQALHADVIFATNRRRQYNALLARLEAGLSTVSAFH